MLQNCNYCTMYFDLSSVSNLITHPIHPINVCLIIDITEYMIAIKRFVKQVARLPHFNFARLRDNVLIEQHNLRILLTGAVVCLTLTDQVVGCPYPCWNRAIQSPKRIIRMEPCTASRKGRWYSSHHIFAVFAIGPCVYAIRLRKIENVMPPICHICMPPIA